MFLRDEAFARAFALLDMIVEAHFYFTLEDRLIVDIVVAGPHLKQLPYHFQRRTHRLHIGIRAEIAGTILNDPAGHEDARVWLIGNHDIRIALIVLEVDIVAGAEFLYEGCFKNERLYLG